MPYSYKMAIEARFYVKSEHDLLVGCFECILATILSSLVLKRQDGIMRREIFSPLCHR
jgi:hypothetical protein